jgi:aspartyl-tRNA(Asn)/glutamyl-tRNA(Gln) amidotransferase subunit A
VFEDQAKAQAEQADQRRRQGKRRSEIDGLPISVKDLFDIEGYTTMAGSVVLADQPAAVADALIVERLRQAGAIVMGTTNMTEFAYSGLGLNPHYGTPLSPWERAIERIAGGSSSGAAASVADGMSVAAIGTDTGGSVRIPAAFCGLVGYKPTASRIDMTGTLPLSLNLDSIGPLANSVTSCIWLGCVMAGESIKMPTVKPLAQTRFCVPQSLVFEQVDEVVAQRFELACQALRDQGAQVDTIELAQLLELATINADGGFTAAQAWQWHQTLLSGERASLYDRRVSTRIERGRALPPDYVARLQLVREDWIARVIAAMSGYDVMLMPTVPVVPPRLAPLQTDDDLYAKSNLLILRNPSVVNFFNGCALSLPCHTDGQAPVGLMIAAAAGQDEHLLGVALACEKALADIRSQ